MTIDDKTRIELEAAAFRRLVDHLRSRTDVQNIDMMDLAGFCRNCLASWMFSEADAMGLAMTRDACREVVYGMPYAEWKAKHQREATPEQVAAIAKRMPKHWKGPAFIDSAGAKPLPSRTWSRRVEMIGRR
jgi:uncharacterized protein